MRFRLRTLLMMLAIGPPVLGLLAWPEARRQYDAWQWREAIKKAQAIGDYGPGSRSGPVLASGDDDDWTYLDEPRANLN
jgi:hypothetical protein